MGLRLGWVVPISLVLLTGCMRGGARAAQLPQPTNFAQWLAIAVVVIGLWWIALKILRG